jgi:hypothetical protein
VNTYRAGENDSSDVRYAGPREWVFPLLATRRYRERIGLLSAIELRRRTECESTLRSLVTDEWTPDTVHHIGWCESCRTAGFALGTGAFAGTSAAAWPGRRRAALVAVAVGLAIAAPVVGSQVIGNPFSGNGAAERGGVAHVIGGTSTGTSGSTGTTGASGSTGTTGSTGSTSTTGSTGGSGSTTPVVVPIPRAKPPHSVLPVPRGQRAVLPLTT